MREHGVVPVATVYHWELPQVMEDSGGWPRRETAERFAEYAGTLAAALGDQVGMWITINEPLQTVHQGYRVGTHAPGRRDLALAAAATHHVLLGHGLAVQAIRSALLRAAPVGCALDLNVTRPAGEGSEAAALRIDAEQNRMYLDPALHGVYPAEARSSMLPPEELIHDRGHGDDLDGHRLPRRQLLPDALRPAR
jgi:beta-glucosidase